MAITVGPAAIDPVPLVLTNWKTPDMTTAGMASRKDTRAAASRV